MSTSADNLAAGLKASVAINALQTALTEESFLLLKALIGDFIRIEVAKAIEELNRRTTCKCKLTPAAKGPRK